MSIPKTGRAIIILESDNKKKLLSIKRTKYKDGNIDRVYYTFPGGHLEGDETYEQATIREVEEELGVTVEIKKEFLNLHNKDLKRNEKFFICDKIKGTIGTGTGPEWTNTNLKKYGKYEIVMIDLEELNSYNILPIEVKEKLIEYKSF